MAASSTDQRMFATLVARELSSSTSLTAGAHDSWRWQLRDKNGQWIEMGSRVKWLDRGIPHTGRISGSSNKSRAYVRDDKDGREREIPTSRLTALDPAPADQPDMDKYTETDYDRYGDPVLAKMDARIREAKARTTITAYSDAKRTPDGRVILDPKMLAKDFPDDTGPHSFLKHVQDGFDADGNKVKVLSKEREAEHDRLVNAIVAGVQPRADGQKIKYFIGGGTASGKSTVTKRMPEYPKVRELKDTDTKPPGEAVLIDPDGIKTSLPEWDSYDEKGRAAYMHEESSMLSKIADREAMKRGLEVVLDGTGDNSPEKMTGKVLDAENKYGYTSRGLYMTVPAGEAIVRSIERGMETGRHVPLLSLTKIHRNVTTTSVGMDREYDHYDLYDTDVPFGRPAIPIIQDHKVVDQARYDAYKAKAAVTDLQAAQEALRRAEAKTYRDITVEATGQVIPAAEVKEYTIREIQQFISRLTASSSSS